MNFILNIFLVSTLTIILSAENKMMMFPGYSQTIENDKEGNLSINQISPCSMRIETNFQLETNLNCIMMDSLY